MKPEPSQTTASDHSSPPEHSDRTKAVEDPDIRPRVTSISNTKRASILEPIARRLSSANLTTKSSDVLDQDKADPFVVTEETTDQPASIGSEETFAVAGADESEHMSDRTACEVEQAPAVHAQKTESGSDRTASSSGTKEDSPSKQECQTLSSEKADDTASPFGTLRANAPNFVPSFHNQETSSTIASRQDSFQPFGDNEWIPDEQWRALSPIERQTVVKKRRARGSSNASSVSYTHLTLPTKRIV